MKNFEQCKYTYAHKKIIEFMLPKYIQDENVLGVMLDRVKNHDMDKMTAYLFWDVLPCHKIHRDSMPHHAKSIECERVLYDYIEMVFDWESARYSKPDKPLNAYDTLYKYYPTMEEYILPILKEFGIAEPNLPFDEEILDFANQVKVNITEEDIKNEVIEYIHRITK